MKKMIKPILALGLSLTGLTSYGDVPVSVFTDKQPLILSQNDKSAADIAATEARLKQKIKDKTVCSHHNFICITPMFQTSSALSTEAEHLVDLTRSNVGLEMKNPGTNLLISVKFSVIPFLKADSVNKKYDEAVEENVRAFAASEVKSALAKAGITPGNPKYPLLFEKYSNLAEPKVEGTISAMQTEGERRIDEIKKQDAFQEIVIGYEDNTYIFRVGKMVAGTFDKNGVTEAEQYIAHRAGTQVATTGGFPRGNIEAGVKDISLNSAVKLSLVAWAGKEGRFFLSANQDTMNVLQMSKSDFDRDADLFGFDSFGAKTKFRLTKTGHELTFTVIEGSKGLTAGTELRVPVTSNLIAHVAYVYAKKQAVDGNQIRGQLDYHIGKFIGAQWVFAPFVEHYEGVQDFSEVSHKVHSEEGKISGNRFGAALSGTVADMLFDGLNATAIIEGYYDDGTVDGTNDSAVVGQGGVGRLGFSSNF